MKKVSDPSDYARFSGKTNTVENSLAVPPRIDAAAPCTLPLSYKVRAFFTSGQLAKSMRRLDLARQAG